MTRWIIGVLLLVGCSRPAGQSTGARLPPLSDEQQAQLGVLNKAYLDVQSSVHWGSRDIFQRMDIGVRPSMDNDLKDCEFDNNRPSDDQTSLPTHGYFYTIIDGEKCPMQLSHRTGYRVSDTSGIGHVDVSLEYAAVSPLKKRANLLAYTIRGRLEVLKQKENTQIGGQINGAIQMREFSIPVVFNVQLRDGVRSYQSVLSVRMNFPDFTVLAEAIRTRQEQNSFEQFKINRIEMNKDEFAKIVGGFMPVRGPLSF